MIERAWREARDVLLVRLDNLGDVLVTTPAFRAVRAALPGARLTLLASPVGAQAGRFNDDIDEVIVYQAPWMDPWGELPHDSSREEAMIRQLKTRGFDAAIIFTSFRQSALPAAYLSYLADIPRRLAASIDGAGSLLTTRHRHPEQLMHEVERGLDLVGALGIPPAGTDLVLDLPPDVLVRAGRRVGIISEMLAGPVVVLHPGCTMPARTYPWQRYAEVADLLIEQLDAHVILTGTESERALTEQIERRMRQPALNLAGSLPFPEFAATIAAADLTITNNTGPMHISAAVKTPVVTLFALTNPPEQWGPWKVPHRLLYHDVPCRICYSRACPYQHECLTLVNPETVVEAARNLLAVTPIGSRPVSRWALRRAAAREALGVPS